MGALSNSPPPTIFSGEGRKGRLNPTLSFSFPSFPSPPISAYMGAHQPLVGWLASLLWPIWPISFPGGSGNPYGSPVCTRYTPEPFRCPNTIVLYMNLYLLTISRLLVMSVISYGTPNNIRSPNHITHIIHIVIER